MELHNHNFDSFRKAILICTAVVGVVLAGSTSFAQEEEASSKAELPASSSVFSATHFQLLKMKCSKEESSELDTTPQSPPLVVDDPGTPGCNQWEINVVVDGDLASGQQSWELPLIDMNYGIGDNLQLKYEVPMQASNTDGQSKTSVGNSKAGVKLKFFEDEDTNLEMALYPQVEFATPQKHATDEETEAGTITTIPLLLSKKVGHVSRGDVNLTANLGYSISSMKDERDSISAAIGFGLPLPARIISMFEISGAKAMAASEDGTRESLLKFDAGIMREVTKGVVAFGSVGRSISSSDEKNHTYVLTGLKL